MILYGILITFVVIVTTLLNIFFNNLFVWYYYIIYALFYLVMVVLIDGIFAGFARWFIPKRFVNKDYKIYNASKRELKIYDFFKIKKWKDYIPELGGFTDFHKDKIRNPKDNIYLERYMLEACYGMWGHFIGAPMGFLILLLDYRMYTMGSNLWLTMALPFGIVNFVLDILPLFILRYNYSRLQIMYKYNQKHKR